MFGAPHTGLHLDDGDPAVVLSDEAIDRSPHDRAIVDLHREWHLVERPARHESRHHIRMLAELGREREGAIEGPVEAGPHIPFRHYVRKVWYVRGVREQPMRQNSRFAA